MLGEQYRRTSCFWGNRTCNGFKNSIQKQDVCLDINVRDHFCQTNYSSSWRPWPKSLESRFHNTYGRREIRYALKYCYHVELCL